MHCRRAPIQSQPSATPLANNDTGKANKYTGRHRNRDNTRVTGMSQQDVNVR
eukprot:m.1654404 g.1654404  ORF g.1654404 m.1654404 type:complete len:52 (+) comp101309_c0_seq1:1-156(+)